MKLDLHLLVDILETVESSDERGASTEDFAHLDPVAFSHHIDLLEHEGLVNGLFSKSFPVQVPRSVQSLHLTWQGHETLDDLRAGSWRERLERAPAKAGDALLTAAARAGTENVLTTLDESVRLLG